MIEHCGGGKYRHVDPETGEWTVSESKDGKTIRCGDKTYPISRFEGDGQDPRGTTQKQADHHHGRPFDAKKKPAESE